MTAHALSLALLMLSPATLTHARASEHAEAALDAHEATGIGATTLLAMAYIESRYQIDAYAFRRGSHLCGALQIATRDRAYCERLRSSLGLSYMHAAQHLVAWRSTSVCQHAEDAMTCALAGYSGGWRSVRSGSSRYARRVRVVAGRIEGCGRRYATI